MAKLPILQEPHKILRRIASEVEIEDVVAGKFRAFIKNMEDTLTSTDVGVGLAAPQVGKPWRIFIVLEEVLVNPKKLGEEEKKEKNKKCLVFINPKILKISKKAVFLTEGCLSVEKVYGKIRRAEKVTVAAYDARGRKFQRGASGLLAEVIQHEMDHLNGLLFIDKARELRKITK